MTIARARPADPLPRPDLTATGRGTGRPSRHSRCHEFLLLSPDLPGRNTAVADALRPIVAVRRGGWVGCPPPARRTRSTYHDGVCLHPVAVTPEDSAGRLVDHYLDATTPPTYDTRWARACRRVNETYADAAAGVAATGGVVLVFGHQLLLVPAVLRRRRPDLLIAFFLDLPLRSAEAFGRMPLRDELLDGVLGADLVGFQNARSADNFRRMAIDHAHVRLGSGGLDLDGRPVGIGVFPQSVDGSAVRDLAATAGNRDRAAAVRAGLGHPERILLAVDDLSPAAGIEQRLVAYENLLDSGDLCPGHTVLVQVVRPDAVPVTGSQELRARIENRVKLINARHGRAGRPAVHYRHRAPDRAELVALYSAADVLWATPLRAGTSLVAKEYVAARADNSGAVVLSTGCGAADELAGADITIPYDVDHQRQVVRRALLDVSTGPRRRMAAMRRHVHTHDVHHWAGSLLAALGRGATDRQATAEVR